MRRLLTGQMNLAAYVALLCNLEAIYAAMELAIAHHAANPVLATIEFRPLARAASLADDIDVLDAGRRLRDGSLRPSTLHYVARLRALDVEQPELLVAHAYVRYLGDLNGGQVLRRLVEESMHLQPARGTSFYDFGDAGRVDGLIEAFKAGLDRTPVASESAVVAEARTAFARHVDLFDELEAMCPPQPGIAG